MRPVVGHTRNTLGLGLAVGPTQRTLVVSILPLWLNAFPSLSWLKGLGQTSNSTSTSFGSEIEKMVQAVRAYILDIYKK